MKKKVSLSYVLALGGEGGWQGRKDAVDALVNIFALDFTRREMPGDPEQETAYEFSVDEESAETAALKECYGVKGSLREEALAFFEAERAAGRPAAFSYRESDEEGRTLYEAAGQ